MEHDSKATKREVLFFFKKRESVSVQDLMSEFGYVFEGARSKLRRLEDGKLITKLGIQPGVFCLTELGHRRVERYDQRQ